VPWSANESGFSRSFRGMFVLRTCGRSGLADSIAGDLDFDARHVLAQGEVWTLTSATSSQPARTAR
jgi:hypothetical protein